jgi:hypothetical protein
LQIFLCCFQSAFWHSCVQYDTLRQPEQRRRSVATVKQCAHLVSAMDFGAELLLRVMPPVQLQIRKCGS